MTDMMNLLEDFYDGLLHHMEMELRRDMQDTVVAAVTCFVILPLIMISMMVIL